ncbi:HXXXD-type acyl-transferase family protein [Rhynchospora pubera]|uniref:HXXXD-type acyl-transferase family protein n=1 Tax=Rhynchospora pubera TaxID=906938 RepID=A0AAV8F059_9POAL|nr:HXXXD-type acyl-transferase family protein [Rhynchospora pubera]
MKKCMEIPDCQYPSGPVLVQPSGSTPKHRLYLSNLDDQKFLRFSIKYLYVFREAVPIDCLRSALSDILVHYYPLAGRLTRVVSGGGSEEAVESEEKLEVDCNGEGAIMAEGFVDISANEFCSRPPNRSWRKLLYRVPDASTFLGVPPLVIQVTHLTCGGMILCTAINHCLCDGIGTSQFLHAWAQATANPLSDPQVIPFHDRTMLKPRKPPQINFSHPEYGADLIGSNSSSSLSLNQFLLSQPLTPISITFSSSHILHLKKQCTPSIKCTSFEMLAVHVWRAWAKSLELPSTLQIKLLFSANVRKKIKPNLPQGFYGNGFVLGCAETPVNQLLASNPYYGIRLIQLAKQSLHDSYVRSVIDLLEEKRSIPDMSASLVISAWSRLGLEELDFGSGKPLHMGPLTSEIYCVFAPVVGDLGAINVVISVPEAVAERFEHYCIKGFEEREEKSEIEGVNNGERYCEIVV